MQRNYVTIRPLNREDSVLYFPPEAFGPFRVLHQIGAGTLGPVFRAYESGRDRLVAIKVFRLDITPEQAAALVSQLEALIAANISHPNIAAPISAGLEEGAAYLAQEHAVGDSLDVVLRDRGPLSMNDAVPLVAALAAAIDHAAARGVHHFSLHPRDIILFGDEAARITGFGIAEALARISAKVTTRPQYASPDGPSDAYSLGAIAFEAVTGKRVSPDNVEEFRAAHGHELRGAFASALAALKPAAPIVPNAPTTPLAPTFALSEPIASVPLDELGAARGTRGPGKPDLALRIDHPVDLMAESDVPPRMLDPIDDLAGSRSGRWPIVAVFLVFGTMAALSVGFFLKSPTPVAIRDPKLGVDETTVELPANSSPAPAPATKTPLPAPTPSRSASGAIARKQEPARGSLLIRSTPADADVVLNGGARGKTPLVLRDLALGSYTIRVARDGYATEERTLELTAQRATAATTFNLRATPTSASSSAMAGKPGGITVQSRPAGARVFVNDRLAGSTPVAIPDLPAGPAIVRIEMDGYQTWATTVRVGVGQQTRVAASLERK